MYYTHHVTAWRHHHPGSALPLLRLAGQDITDAFHPPSAAGLLHNFFTGYFLKDYSVSEVSKDYPRLVTQISKSGLFNMKGHGTMISLCCIAMLFVLSVCGVLLCEGKLVHLLYGAEMGFLWTQSGWMGHDSGHYNVMSGSEFNRFTHILTWNCLSGISIAWWKWNHNAHHITCNSVNFDPDLQHIPLSDLRKDVEFP